jgi:hypothetical protein
MRDNSVAQGLVLTALPNTLGFLDAFQVFSSIVELFFNLVVVAIRGLVSVKDLILCVEACHRLVLSITVQLL